MKQAEALRRPIYWIKRETDRQGERGNERQRINVRGRKRERERNQVEAGGSVAMAILSPQRLELGLDFRILLHPRHRDGGLWIRLEEWNEE